jgi:hypothetical protein
MKSTTSMLSALRYELVRVFTSRSTRGVTLLSLLGSAVLTLPAARQVVGLDRPLPPSLVRQFTAANQPLPSHGGGAWVVAGGTIGLALPVAAAVCGAAWLGATSIGYEYRYGGGLLTYVLVPRRGAVLLAKVVVAAGFGVLLSVAARAVAYGTARLGFTLAGTKVLLPAALLAPAPREVAMGALGGALGVLAGAVLRLRAVATLVAVAGCALVTAGLPGSSSGAVPYLARGVRDVARVVPGVTYGMVLNAALVLPPLVVVLAGVVAVRRRRVV